MSLSQEEAFPRLSTAELAVLRSLATAHDYVDGEAIFRAGQADIDLHVVESGKIDILNPAEGNRLIVSHHPGQFSGDIDPYVKDAFYDYVLFYEYFDGDTGRGLGASHQTGWTALVACLLEDCTRRRGARAEARAATA